MTIRPLPASAASPANAARLRCDLVLTVSEHRILDIVRRHPGISRAEIAVQTDLAQQSVHRLVEQLVQRGLLQVGETVRKGRGQPSPRIALVSAARYALGVSVSTEAVTVCLADMGCQVLEEVTLHAAPRQRAATLAAIGEAIGQMLARNQVPRSRILGLCLAIPGFFVAERRQMNASEPLRDWSLVDLRPGLEEAFGLPVWLENSATTAAIGESLVGVGRWAQNFVYLAFNYGFGSGVILGGKPLFGTHGNAGELALFTAAEDRQRPTLRLLIEMLREEGVAVDSVADLRLRFDPNWPGVASWIERVLPALDRTVNAYAGLLDPEAIVFGGQLPPALGQLLLERVRFLDLHRYGVGPARPVLALSETRGDAAAIGAALVPLKDCLYGEP